MAGESTMISGKTKVCGLIGDPVEHSISPTMHNAAFAFSGLDYIYVPFRVTPTGLGEAINGMRALNIRGLNVTIPHKVAVLPFLDEVDSLAKQIGAVNSIVNDGNILKGYNTDSDGFVQVLLEGGIDPGHKRVTVLGAGGAARAVIFGLASRNAEITILNRIEDFDRAIDLSASVANIFKQEVRALELTENNLANIMGKTDILVNATSVGMIPNRNSTLVDKKWMKPELVVYDIVYNPVETRLLREAREAGAHTMSGLEMLVRQGAMSFEKWTEQPAPVEVMREAAVRGLKGKF